jgi:RimJ/RimL family protein N-acetyltransferase
MKMKTWAMTDLVRLRPIEESELADMLRCYWDLEVTGEFQWFGFRLAKAREVERRWAEDGLVGAQSGRLAVGLDGGGYAGDVDWRAAGETGNFEIGIVLLPEYRGRGIGTEAQRQLVDYLFATTPVHRLQAGTEVDNIAEQRALERVGFRREGVARGLYFRDGKWPDGVLYGLLRDDPRNSSAPPHMAGR